MADFYQMGVIATLHRLGAGNVGILERQLEYFSRQQPIALVLPALYSEFEKPAMDTMIARAQPGHLRPPVRFVPGAGHAGSAFAKMSSVV
jgi:hypothetical protein